MSNRSSFAVLILAALISSERGLAASEPVSVSSPDGRIQVHLSVKEKLDPYPAGSRLYYSVSMEGREILLDSPFGLDFKDMPPIARDLAIKGQPGVSKASPRITTSIKECAPAGAQETFGTITSRWS